MQYKGLLFKLAYQLTGSVSDAEDVVQDVFLKLYAVPPEKLAEPKAYLCRMVTNRCRDLHKSARKQREEYYGEWLPEPLPDTHADAMASVERHEVLSYAMLVLLERLSTSERFVFVLREALGFDYHEIAGLLDKSEVSCRKLFSRASAKMGLAVSAAEEPVQPDPASREWVHGFLTALQLGDMDRILALLDKNVVLIPDGGGKASAAVNPIGTRDRVARFLAGIVRKLTLDDGGDGSIAVVAINGQPSLTFRTGQGSVHTAIMLHREGDSVRNVYLVRNPDKLTSLSAGG